MAERDSVSAPRPQGRGDDRAVRFKNDKNILHRVDAVSKIALGLPPMECLNMVTTDYRGTSPTRDLARIPWSGFGEQVRVSDGVRAARSSRSIEKNRNTRSPRAPVALRAESTNRKRPTKRAVAGYLVIGISYLRL